VVHAWSVSQLRRLGLAQPTAEAVADNVDWHEVARLVQLGSSARAQLAPLERLGKQRGEIAIRRLATYLDQQGSIVRPAQALHQHRNAVTYRLRRIIPIFSGWTSTTGSATGTSTRVPRAAAGPVAAEGAVAQETTPAAGLGPAQYLSPVCQGATSPNCRARSCR
jgi:hypothetical protein